MSVYLSIAASKAQMFVPCMAHSISVIELKDAIAAPLLAALQMLREQFDFRIYDPDTKEEIVSASSRVSKNASVLVKRVPSFVVFQQRQ